MMLFSLYLLTWKLQKTPFLESNEKILWILGGLFKKGDKFNLNKKYFKNLEAYIYGKDRQVFLKLFKNKIKVNLSKDLRNTLKLIPNLKDIRTKVTVLFSPSAASFDQYKNFEERGRQFNMLIKRYLPIEWINILIHFMIGGKTSIKQFFW